MTADMRRLFISLGIILAALVAAFAFTMVLQGPLLRLAMPAQDEGGAQEDGGLTYEEKASILESVAEDEREQLTEAEKEKTLESVSSGEKQMSAEDKLRILEGL